MKIVLNQLPGPRFAVYQGQKNAIQFLDTWHLSNAHWIQTSLACMHFLIQGTQSCQHISLTAGKPFVNKPMTCLSCFLSSMIHDLVKMYWTKNYSLWKHMVIRFSVGNLIFKYKMILFLQIIKQLKILMKRIFTYLSAHIHFLN